MAGFKLFSLVEAKVPSDKPNFTMLADRAYSLGKPDFMECPPAQEACAFLSVPQGTGEMGQMSNLRSSGVLPWPNPTPHLESTQ
jgi:hypothetical protein